jgi:hypothetical protein
MFLLAWTINHGQNRLEDFFTLHESEKHANANYRDLIRGQDKLHCAAVSKITEATEPQWIDDLEGAE